MNVITLKRIPLRSEVQHPFPQQRSSAPGWEESRGRWTGAKKFIQELFTLPWNGRKNSWNFMKCPTKRWKSHSPYWRHSTILRYRISFREILGVTSIISQPKETNTVQPMASRLRHPLTWHPSTPLLMLKAPQGRIRWSTKHGLHGQKTIIYGSFWENPPGLKERMLCRRKWRKAFINNALTLRTCAY